ncbi:MAG: hypothetical protein LIO37_01405 [Clostridiales bacterium]|nr:hypothetical protein [Clostridiales bacterium]
MIAYKELKGDGLGKTCRQCLNERYHLKLKPTDCIYYGYKYPCIRCGQVGNIVIGIRRISRWKLLFGRRPRG